MNECATLKVDCGNGNLLYIPLDALNPQVVGCGADCDIRLQGTGISRRHCQFEKRKDGWLITDLASTNGTSINGTRILGSEPRGLYSAALKDGDVINIGTFNISFSLSSIGDNTELLFIAPPIESDPKAESRSRKSSSTAKQKRTTASHPAVQITTAKSNSESSDNIHTKPESTDALPSLLFGRYEVDKKLSHDDWGLNYLVHVEDAPEKLLLLRMLYLNRLQDSIEEKRLHRSISLLQELNHRCIVKYIESGESEEFAFVVTEYCNGGSLQDLYSRGVTFNYRRAIKLADKILSGLEVAHANGIVHRNLSPSSILLEKNQHKSFYPKIADFSIAKKYISTSFPIATVKGTVAGDWLYMPREQLVDFVSVKPNTDTWSLGAIIYEGLTNRLPRPIPEGVNPINTIIYADTIPIQLVLPDIPAELAIFLNTALAPHPSDRFANAMIMRASLRTVASQIGITL
jgi:pSer/pThr/pTyr-binding forkhead associated (FHA) protein